MAAKLLGSLNLSERLYSGLIRNGIHTKEQLEAKSLLELSQLKGMGPKALTELATHPSLSFKPDET